MFGNMAIEKKLDNVNWSNMIEVTSNEEFNAILCNEIAHEAIARKERNLVINLIRKAAESGCFRTILPKCHSDTTKWLTDLGFKIYYQGQTEVSWENN